MNTLFIPYDTYERHRRVGEFIQNGKTVVDIGGQLNMLSKFCHATKIVVANLGSSEEISDVTIQKDILPFKNNSFDISCAIDVLEHIPKKKRQDFVKSLVKVSSQKAILSFPVGTEEHIAYEKELENWLNSKDHDVGYLKEHIKFGLPTKNEIEALTKDLKARVFFSGDLLVNKILFKIFIFDPKVPILRRLIFFMKRFFYLWTNPILYAVLANKPYSRKVVRAYLIIEK